MVLVVLARYLRWSVYYYVSVNEVQHFRDNNQQDKEKVYFCLDHSWFLRGFPHVNQVELAEHVEKLNIAENYNED
jgi:hypothetical protein